MAERTYKLAGREAVLTPEHTERLISVGGRMVSETNADVLTLKRVAYRMSCTNGTRCRGHADRMQRNVSLFNPFKFMSNRRTSGCVSFDSFIGSNT